MSNRRIGIIDDEDDSREILRNYLSQEYPNLEIAAEANSITSGVDLLNSVEIDLLFLDIQFPSGTGFDILKATLSRSFKTIFVTAYDQYAIKAIKNNAFDYILKPLDRDELCLVVNKYLSKELIGSPTKEAKSPSLLNEQITVPTLRGFRVLPHSDIVRLESDSNYTKIFLDGGDEILISRSIKEYEEVLPKDSFCRIHNSHIINVTFLNEYVKGRGGEVILRDGSKISVSQNRKADFMKFFK